MRAFLVLMTLLLVGTSAAPALADEAASPVPTTTQIRWSTSGETLTLDVQVAAQDDSVPEGSVVLDLAGSGRPTLTLVGGRATWTGDARTTSSWGATYEPADDRWAPSISAFQVVDMVAPAVGLTVRGTTVRAGERGHLRVAFAGAGALPRPGRVTLRLTGPGGFAWTRQARIADRKKTVLTPRLVRPGTYRLRVAARLDTGAQETRTIRLRVVRRPAQAL